MLAIIYPDSWLSLGLVLANGSTEERVSLLQGQAVRTFLRGWQWLSLLHGQWCELHLAGTCLDVESRKVGRSSPDTVHGSQNLNSNGWRRWYTFPRSNSLPVKYNSINHEIQSYSDFFFSGKWGGKRKQDPGTFFWIFTLDQAQFVGDTTVLESLSELL